MAENLSYSDLNALLDEANDATRRALSNIQDAKKAIFGEVEIETPTDHNETRNNRGTLLKLSGKMVVIPLNNNPLSDRPDPESEATDDL